MLRQPDETAHFSARDGIQLQYRLHRGEPGRPAVVVVHGFAEHGGRYQELVEALVPAGFSVLTYDARGHGHSGGRRVYVDRFEQYVEDLADAIALAEKRLGKPAYLFAHSMGGLVALRLLADQPGVVQGAVLSNPALRNRVVVPAWKILVARGASKYVPTLAVPSGLPPEDMSRDPAQVRAYSQDPLNSKVATARWYTEFTAAQDALLQRADRLRDVPSLFLLGEGDRVIDARVGTDFANRIAGKDVTVRVYPGFYHELIHEPETDRQQVLADVRKWLEARAQPTAS